MNQSIGSMMHPRNEAEDEIVERMSSWMLMKLRANSHKPHWEDLSNDDLFNLMLDEVRELQEALMVLKHHCEAPVVPTSSDILTQGRVSMVDCVIPVMTEAADVCNFAAMLCDNLAHRYSAN